MPTPNLPCVILVLGSLLLWLPCQSSLSQAQTPPITSSGLNTQVNLSTTPPEGKVQYDITGGTRPEGGLNLFHSFREFDVPTTNLANFLNETALPTSNILARITGNIRSNILGTIQTTGFENANLFLINPYGFLFGPNATVNVGGLVAFTSADYLRLTDNARFSAIPNVAADILLTASPVAAFGFLGSDPGAISVQGSQFTVTEGTGISLVGGNVTIEAGTPNGAAVQPAILSASAGWMNLASAASPGEFLAGTLEQVPNINDQSFGALGNIQLSQKSLLDVSGDGGGSVMIRGGRFVVDDSMILANVTGPGIVTDGLESIGSGIDIQVSQNAVIQNGALLDTTVSSNASPGVQYGGVSVKADSIEILGSQDFDNFPVTGIFSSVAQGNTGGSSGDIKLEANSILARDFGTVTTFLETATDGAGNAGDIELKATNNLELDGVVFVESLASASGNAGNIALRSAQGNILMTNSPFVNSLTGSLSSGSVGSIEVNAPNGDILLTGNPEFGPATLFTHIDGTGSNAGKGGILLTARNLTIENSGIQIDNFTSFQPGDLRVNLTDTLSLSGIDIPSTLLTTTRGSARSADLNIIAHKILLTDSSLVSTETYRSGDAGTLNISARRIEIKSGAEVTSRSIFNPFPSPGQPLETPSGAGGAIVIQGLNSPAESVLIDGPTSGIFTNTEGTGAGGNTTVSARTLTIQNGGTISASTSGTVPSAAGGSITINMTDQVTMTGGASVSASSTGPGNAGNITITGESLTIASGSRIEASTSGTGDGGSIDITTTGDVTVTGLSDNGQIRSGIFAKTLSAGGGSGTGSGGGGSGGGGGLAPKPGSAGDITITANNLLLNSGAQIDSSTTSGGAGGNVSITTAENITIAGSSTRLTSDAIRGDGKGGNITLVAKNVTVRDSASVTAVTGGKGAAGNVTLTALDQLLLQSTGTITTSTSGSGKGGTIIIQASQVLLDGPGTGISADTLRPFADMTITINILHPNDGDLVVLLDTPTGTRVALLSRVGGSGNNFTGTQFNDQATTQITSGSAPFTDTFTPREPLGQLNNELVAGKWALNVRDQTTGNVGSLESWTLQIGTQTFQSTGGSKMIPDNGNVRSTITVTNPTVPTVKGVGEAPGIGGNVTINAGTVTVQNGATMSATTRGSGQGGTLTVNATSAVALTGSGSGLFTESEASGAGGNITLTAGQSVTMSDGASVSANSTGQGNAGKITIHAGNTFEARNSSVTTKSEKAGGGDIEINALDQIRLVNSQVNASAFLDGGNITIDPNVVILQNSQILAQAIHGAGGNITIFTPLFLADSTSLVSASSQFGLNGTVTIQSPTSNLSGSLGTLTSTPSQAQALLTQRCAALANSQASSFVVAGREQLPSNPGGWLTSPLALAGIDADPFTDGTVATIPATMDPHDTGTVSLRRLTPSGFLIANFADSEATGCHS
jgi:filamentous hemagglutinin family protein